MKQNISVDIAIMKGHLIVNLPVVFFLFACPGFSFYLYQENLIPKWGIGIAFLIGFILSWIVWSIMITKWRIWAFENVRNVHELKKRAIRERLIWRDGSIFEKTEIRSRSDKDKLKILGKKFEKDDVYREDYSIPPKTLIYYSKKKSYIELVISIGLVILSIYMINQGEKKGLFLGVIMIAICLFSLIKELKKILNNEPQIEIDKYGIKTKNIVFKEWNSIRDEEVTVEGYGKSMKSYLKFYYDNNKLEKIKIDDFNIKNKELTSILRTYRLRFNKL
jgi:uncharacterized membrane protein YciS (DUF1049 family)